MRILLVDDEVVALNALKKRVDWIKYGFTEVYTAKDTETAKRIMERGNVEVVLCDVEIQGENGLKLISYIKENYADTKCVMITCHADFEYVQQAMRYGARDYILKPIDYEELDALLMQLMQEIADARTKAKISRIVEHTRKRKDFGTQAGDTFDADSNEERLSKVKSYIEEHIQEKISMKNLAEQIHMNEQYLMRIFKRETGQSILEYLTERKIIIASNMLKDTDYSINFIADCVGCENYSYFTKLFKKQTGFTPREYRGQFKSTL